MGKLLNLSVTITGIIETGIKAKCGAVAELKPQLNLNTQENKELRERLKKYEPEDTTNSVPQEA